MGIGRGAPAGRLRAVSAVLPGTRPSSSGSGKRTQRGNRIQVMKTLVTAIQKGGQGKTFATCHPAFDFLERGLRVAVIDLDTQGNASFTLSQYQSGYAASQLFSGRPMARTNGSASARGERPGADRCGCEPCEPGQDGTVPGCSCAAGQCGRTGRVLRRLPDRYGAVPGRLA